MRLTIAWLALLAAGAAQAQDRDRPQVALAPVAVELEGDWTAGLKFHVAAGSRRHEVSSAFPRSSYWRAEARGILALDEDLNPDPIFVAAAGGLSISLAKPNVITFDPENVDAPARAMAFDYGDLSLGAQGLLETNQARTETRLSGNAEVVYTHDHQRGIWPFIPALYARVGVARSIESEARDSLSIPDTQSYMRLAGGVAWHISADRGWAPTFMRPVWLHAEIDVYREDGGESTTLDGTRVALGVAYRLLSERRGWLDEVFLRWTNGETPVLPAPGKAWRLGIVLAR